MKESEGSHEKFLKTLVVGLCLFTLLCCALPAAFAADKTSGSKKEENVYAIGMDAQGGICSTVVTYTNLSGKLESTPEQPTMTGYTFDGWYTEPVGGSKVTTSTVFTSDATIYAHWTAKVGTTVPQPTTPPATTQWQKYVGPALVAGALLTTLLVATMF